MYEIHLHISIYAYLWIPKDLWEEISDDRPEVNGRHLIWLLRAKCAPSDRYHVIAWNCLWLQIRVLLPAPSSCCVITLESSLKRLQSLSNDLEAVHYSRHTIWEPDNSKDNNNDKSSYGLMNICYVSNPALSALCTWSCLTFVTKVSFIGIMKWIHSTYKDQVGIMNPLYRRGQ